MYVDPDDVQAALENVSALEKKYGRRTERNGEKDWKKRLVEARVGERGASQDYKRSNEAVERLLSEGDVNGAAAQRDMSKYHSERLLGRQAIVKGTAALIQSREGVPGTTRRRYHNTVAQKTRQLLDDVDDQLYAEVPPPVYRNIHSNRHSLPPITFPGIPSGQLIPTGGAQPYPSLSPQPGSPSLHIHLPPAIQNQPDVRYTVGNNQNGSLVVDVTGFGNRVDHRDDSMSMTSSVSRHYKRRHRRSIKTPSRDRRYSNSYRSGSVSQSDSETVSKRSPSVGSSAVTRSTRRGSHKSVSAKREDDNHPPPPPSSRRSKEESIHPPPSRSRRSSYQTSVSNRSESTTASRPPKLPSRKSSRRSSVAKSSASSRPKASGGSNSDLLKLGGNTGDNNDIMNSGSNTPLQQPSVKSSKRHSSAGSEVSSRPSKSIASRTESKLTSKSISRKSSRRDSRSQQISSSSSSSSGSTQTKHSVSSKSHKSDKAGREEAALEAERVVQQAESDRLAKEEADRLAKEEADRLTKEEADRLAEEKADRLAKEEADRLAKEEADRLAKEEADRLAEEKADRLAKEEAERQNAEEERLAKEEADRQARDEAERVAKEEAERKAAEAEAEVRAREEAERLAKEEAAKASEKERAEAERKLAEAEAERKAAEAEAKRLAEEEAERQATEEAERKAEAERLAKEEAERQAKEQERKAEAERLAKEEADRKAKEEAEREAEKKAQEEADRKAKEESERKAREEADRKAAATKAAEEAAMKAKEEADKKAREEEARQLKAKEEQERLAKEEEEKQAQEKAAKEEEQRAKEKADKKYKEEEEKRLAKEKADKKAKEEEERQAKEDEAKKIAEKKAQEDTSVLAPVGALVELHSYKNQPENNGRRGRVFDHKVATDKSLCLAIKFDDGTKKLVKPMNAKIIEEQEQEQEQKQDEEQKQNSVSPDSSSNLLPRGSHVELHSFTNQPAFNGRLGTVFGYKKAPDGAECLVVELDGGKKVLAKPKNVKLAPGKPLGGIIMPPPPDVEESLKPSTAPQEKTQSESEPSKKKQPDSDGVVIKPPVPPLPPSPIPSKLSNPQNDKTPPAPQPEQVGNKDVKKPAQDVKKNEREDLEKKPEEPKKDIKKPEQENKKPEQDTKKPEKDVKKPEQDDKNEPDLKVGMKVEIHSFVNPEERKMNGRQGEITELKNKDGETNYVIKIHESDDKLTVKKGNLLVVHSFSPTRGACHPVGSTIEIHSLQRLKDLNGTKGKVIGHKIASNGLECMITELPDGSKHLIKPNNGILVIDKGTCHPIGSTIKLRHMADESLNGKNGKVTKLVKGNFNLDAMEILTKEGKTVIAYPENTILISHPTAPSPATSPKPQAKNSSSFPIGSTIEIHSLVKMQELNGKKATVTAHKQLKDGTQALEVTFPDGKKQLMKTSNAKIVATGAASSPASPAPVNNTAEFPIGSNIVLHSLVKVPELNGKHAKVTAHKKLSDGTQGLEATFPDGKKQYLKPANAKLVQVAPSTPQAKPPNDNFEIGTSVVLHSLKKKSQLNGMKGTVVAYKEDTDGTDSMVVKMEKGNAQLVKRKYAKKIDPSAASPSPSKVSKKGDHQFPVGARVVLKDFENKKQFNGKSGKVVAHKQVDGEISMAVVCDSGENLLVKNKNLRLEGSKSEPPPQSQPQPQPPPQSQPQPPPQSPKPDDQQSQFPIGSSVETINFPIPSLNGKRGVVMEHKKTVDSKSAILVKFDNDEKLLQSENLKRYFEPCHPVGSTVEVHSLKKQVTLNGLKGKVTSHRTEKGGTPCMLVTFPDGNKQLLKPANARLVVAGSEPSQAAPTPSPQKPTEGENKNDNQTTEKDTSKVDKFPVGSNIEIQGLKKATHMNGKTGTVVSHKEKGNETCLVVKMDDGSQQLLKPENANITRGSAIEPGSSAVIHSHSPELDGKTVSVVKCTGDNATVTIDGKEMEMSCTSHLHVVSSPVRKRKFVTGDKVKVRGAKVKDRVGTVTTLNKDGKYVVEFENGKKETHAPEKLMKDQPPREYKPPPEECHPFGTKVIVQGLTGAKDLNGKPAIVIGYNKDVTSGVQGMVVQFEDGQQRLFLMKNVTLPKEAKRRGQCGAPPGVCIFLNNFFSYPYFINNNEQTTKQCYPIGQRVKVTGLVTQADLNNKIVMVVDYKELGGTWCMQVDTDGKGNIMYLKPKNTTML